MILSARVTAEIRAHAESVYPNESCGLLVVMAGKHKYIPCRNLSTTPRAQFVLDPADYANAEDAGHIAAIVHSHPDVGTTPSEADRVICEQGDVPWLIVAWPAGTMEWLYPSGYVAPLVGRRFHHGTLDCYTLVRDYYKRELAIELPDYPRSFEWWLKGGNLYLDGFEAAGFVRVADGKPRKHDGLLMRIGSPVPNHAAVWLGDGTIMHHLMNRLSTREVYGGWYQRATTHVVRHRSLI